MTKNQAELFSIDIRKVIKDSDFSQNIYVSIKNVGTKTFSNVCFQVIEGWLFIWSRDESFCVKEKDLGDFVYLDISDMPSYNLKNYE